MNEKKMTLVEHMEELRARIIVSLVLSLAGTLAAYYFRTELFDFLVKPAGRLVFLSPAEGFMAYLEISIAAGIVLSSPVILYQIYAFIAPALKPAERRWLSFGVPVIFLLFFSGIAFAYFLLGPVMKFLLSFQGPELSATISVSRYFSFILVFFLGCGLVFEMPVLAFVLAKLNLIKASMLLRHWRAAILIIFIIAAAVTPTPDIFNQTIVAVPMILLYGVSIFVVKLAEKD